MSKRSAEEKIERYRNKIKKLEENSCKRRRVRVIYSDSSDEDEGAPIERSVVTAQVHNVTTDVPVTAPAVTTSSLAPNPPMAPTASAESTALAEPTAQIEPAALAPVSPLIPPADPSERDVILPSSQEVGELVTDEPISKEPQAVVGIDDISELDPDLLEALGEFTGDTPEFGDKIHENLAQLWLPLLKKGMDKDKKEKINKEYLVPDNCRLFQAPKLNAEISAAVPDMVRNRDKGLTAQQQQIGFGLTAVNRALDLLLKGDDKKMAIQHLSNGCRILSDLHSCFTQNRIKLVTPSLDKSFLHVIQDSQRDETLFGNKLSEKIKAAKAIEKQGLQIKKVTNTKTPPGSCHSVNSGYNRSTHSGNWSAPHRYQSSRGSRGGAKKSAPARRPYASSTQQVTKSSSASKPRAPPTTQ